MTSETLRLYPILPTAMQLMLEDDVKESDPGEALLDMGNTPKVGVGEVFVLGKPSH